RIEAIDAGLGGTFGVSAIDLASGAVFSYHAATEFPTASSIKIAIMIQMFRDAESGRIRFSDAAVLDRMPPNDDSEGPLHEALFHGPVRLPALNRVEHMIQYSDNTATNKCIDLVGMDRVNALVRGFGLNATRLRRRMMDVEAAARGDENVSTPEDM